MIKWCALACLMVFGAAEAAAGVIEVPLEYVRAKRSPGSPYMPGGAAILELAATPAADMQLPDLADAVVLYSTLSLGDTEFPVALARAQKDTEYAYTLYIGLNDGKVHSLEGVTESYGDQTFGVEFAAYDFEYRIGDKTLPMAVEFRMYDRLDRELEDNAIIAYPAGGYTGVFELNGEKYRVIVGDGEFNGRFGDKMRLWPDLRSELYTSGDVMILLPAEEKAEYADSVAVTDYVYFHGTLYALAIDVPGGKLTLKPADRPLVPLNLPPEIRTLQLLNSGNGQSVALFFPEQEVEIPAGSYRMVSYLLERTEPVGDVWRLGARGVLISPLLKAAAGETAALEFGEPYSIVLDNSHVRLRATRRGYRLNVSVTGSAGEKVSSLARVSGDKTTIPMEGKTRPRPPQYRIAAEDGEVVATGNFEYG